jgi:aspartyl-tRNA(Asn)/glutamyl-tRNA(Gln) amidotransferase subunit A
VPSSAADTGTPSVTLLDELLAGRTTAAAHLETCLSRIAAVEERVGAFVTVDAEGARVQAHAADEAMAAGRPLGPLHGLPIGLKDNIDTADLRTTVGSAFFLDNVPMEDAEVVRRLRAAGAVIAGKITMHELAFGATSQNVHTGPCRNPWDLDRVPGGSSGGSGAVVAADELPVSLGTDTGGSIRIPGALNGVVGLRPTSGRVSNRGIFPVAATFDTCAPLAWDAIDVARVLTAIAGYDPGDPVSVDVPSPDYAEGIDAGIDGLRVGVISNFAFDETDSGVVAAVRAAAEQLATLGARVEEIEVPGLEHTHEWATAMIRGEAWARHRERMTTEPERFSADVLRRLRGAEVVTGADYAAGREACRAWARSVELLFADVDVLLSPTAGTVAPLAEGTDMIEATARLTRATYGWSAGDFPAISVPCGFAEHGMPVGLQLAAARWNEALLLRVAHAYQSATDWHTRRPNLA